MSVFHNTPCVILAGGGSKRFGSPKGLADVNGALLINHVLNRLTHQSSAPIAINANEPGFYKNLCRPILIDHPGHERIGPLAGIAAAMRWGQEVGASAVATVPVDTPFLPMDLLVRFESVGTPVVATSAGRVHAVCGLWNPHQLESLEQSIAIGVRAARAWADVCGAQHCEFEVQSGRDPFFNINRQDDLKQALDMLER